VTATNKPAVSVGSGVAGPSAQTLEDVIALTVSGHVFPQV